MAIRFLLTALVALWLGVAASPSQELDLNSYLRLLKLAPGNTVEQKMSALEGLGARLSPEGLRELTNFAKSRSNTSASPRVRTSIESFTHQGDSSTGRTGTLSGTRTRIGNSDFYNFSNGVTGTGTKVGSHQYYNFSNGLSGNSNRIGQFEHRNWNNGLRGTSNRVGNTTFHNRSDGVSGTSQQLGNFEFHNFSDGTNCTTTRLGSYTTTNCR